jgi:hypothetical protein
MSEIVPAPGDMPAPAPARSMATPAEMIQYVMANNGSIDQLEKFYALQQRWEADQARKAFVAAKAAFKAENVVVARDKENKQYNSTYTSLGNLVGTVSPILSKHGLSADWDIDQSDGIVVTCILSHSMGHSDRVSLKVPPDTAGAKNPIQQIKSAITYAKAVTFESVCGLASTDANHDDDGTAAGTGGVSYSQDWVEAARMAADAATLEKVWTDGVAEIQKAKDQILYDQFKTAVVARKKKIAEGGSYVA